MIVKQVSHSYHSFILQLIIEPTNVPFLLLLLFPQHASGKKKLLSMKKEKGKKKGDPRAASLRKPHSLPL